MKWFNTPYFWTGLVLLTIFYVATAVVAEDRFGFFKKSETKTEDAE